MTAFADQMAYGRDIAFENLRHVLFGNASRTMSRNACRGRGVRFANLCSGGNDLSARSMVSMISAPIGPLVQSLQAAAADEAFHLDSRPRSRGGTASPTSACVRGVRSKGISSPAKDHRNALATNHTSMINQIKQMDVTKMNRSAEPSPRSCLYS